MTKKKAAWLGCAILMILFFGYLFRWDLPGYCMFHTKTIHNVTICVSPEGWVIR